MNRICVLALAVLGAMSIAATAIAQSQWVIGSGRSYQVQGTGDAAGEQGATVTLRSGNGEPEKFGASLARLDASPYRNKTIALSADLDTRDAQQGAGIWLRADGADGKLAFANSQREPVFGTVLNVHRQVQIDVPEQATVLVFGTLLSGNGEVVAHKLRLTAMKPEPTAQVAPDLVLDAAIRTVREHALHARDVDWPQAEPEIRAMAKNAKTSKDVYPAIRALLAKLGDHHSMLLEPQASRRFAEGGAPSSMPIVELKPDNIGYIEMPGYSGVEAKAQAEFVGGIVDAIGKIAPQAHCGWIVDLRRNVGGNMYPMLGSLRPLLGPKPLGSFRHANGESTPFTAVNGPAASPRVGPDLQSAPIAVLTGPQTASSGEVVAVAFRGRPNTRSFGAATAGLSTGNRTFSLGDGSMLALTTVVDMDRDGHVYGGKIEPDETVAPAKQGGADETLAAAAAWLVRSPSCKR
ncbi:S41 family peptidase [Rudaea sp. 3F27F6]|uniref:S41 family peptidase n=1 Tax=Rudaea sp. 3F27F6 TaxID=2502208 RepID=UPI0010F7B341|nr:S41 family peptidase [Rudaea sp. 3F27F6]